MSQPSTGIVSLPARDTWAEPASPRTGPAVGSCIWGSCRLARCLEIWATSRLRPAPHACCAEKCPSCALPPARIKRHREPTEGVEGLAFFHCRRKPILVLLPPLTPSCCAEAEGVAINQLHLPITLHRSPEQSKASAGSGSDNCIEPVSPPDGVGESEHAKSATYPILYREGEQIDQR